MVRLMDFRDLGILKVFTYFNSYMVRLMELLVGKIVGIATISIPIWYD